LKELEVFVEDCLLLADSEGYSTVAIPVLGTGKLGYPLQDVAVTLFNGVDRYVSEGTIGAISSVCISVPVEEDDVYKVWLLILFLCSPKNFGGAYSHRVVRPTVSPHYRIGIGSHLTVNRTKENNRVHSVTIE
jgi:hypothetical protein